MQLAAASLLGRLQVQPLHGPRVTLTLQRLLPQGLVAAIQASPPSGCQQQPVACCLLVCCALRSCTALYIIDVFSCNNSRWPLALTTHNF